MTDAPSAGARLARPPKRLWDYDQLVDELVAANQILLHHQIVDAFGHVSARHPDRPDRFLMAQRKAPSLVVREDIREYNLDGELADADGSPSFLERYIHSAIYAARPDVQSVIHSHSPGVIAFGVVPSRPLRAICHTCGFLGLGAPVFEIRDEVGPASNLMITSQALGAALARALGDASYVLMRGHGSTAVGSNLPEAVYNAIYAESAARIQSAALALGPITFMSEEEAAATSGSSSIVVERTWNHWKEEVGLR
jgi:ribulose-5-phosphate 4-epimerase/fuculose-1-phosphate aldolase